MSYFYSAAFSVTTRWIGTNQGKRSSSQTMMWTKIALEMKIYGCLLEIFMLFKECIVSGWQFPTQIRICKHCRVHFRGHYYVVLVNSYLAIGWVILIGTSSCMSKLWVTFIFFAKNEVISGIEVRVHIINVKTDTKYFLI